MPVSAVPKVVVGNGSLTAVQRHLEKQTSLKPPIQMGEGYMTGAVLRHLSRKTPPTGPKPTVQMGDGYLAGAVLRHLSRKAPLFA